MTTGVVASPPILQFTLSNGQLAVGGSILTQVGGVNAATYSDIGLSTPLPNPIPLNSRGEISDSNGQSQQLFLTPNIVYTFTLFDAKGNQIWQATYVNGVQVTLTQDSIGQVLFPETEAEQTAGVTPTNFAYQADPIADIRRYGWSSTNTASQNTTILNNAIAVRTAAGGGIIQLPAGSFDITDSIIIPQYVTVRGVGGTNGTTLTSNSTDDPAFLLGGNISGVLKYGCSLTDVQIVLSNGNGKAVQLMETVQAVLRNIYIQGPITAGRSTKGVVIDGGNVGAFFNYIENVECSHIHIGFDQLSSGTTAPTTQYFVNISGIGDYSDPTNPDTTSIGYRLQGASDTGNGTVISEADFEQYGRSYYFTAGCGSSTNLGIRSENTPTSSGSLDVLIETGAGAQTFIGGIMDMPDGKVVVNTNVPLNTINGAGIPHRFWGIANGSNMPNNGYWAGTNFFYGAVTGDSPLIGVAFPGDTAAKILDIQDSTGASHGSIDASGNMRGSTLRVNGATPTGSAGQLSLGSSTALTANTGSQGAPPGQVAGYLTIDLSGTKFKVPYYAN